MLGPHLERPFGGSEGYAFSADGRELAYSAKDQGREDAWSTDVPVSTTTGIVESRWYERMTARNSGPFIVGIARSSRISDGNTRIAVRT